MRIAFLYWAIQYSLNTYNLADFVLGSLPHTRHCATYFTFVIKFSPKKKKKSQWLHDHTQRQGQINDRPRTRA